MRRKSSETFIRVLVTKRKKDQLLINFVPVRVIPLSVGERHELLVRRTKYKVHPFRDRLSVFDEVPCIRVREWTSTGRT